MLQLLLVKRVCSCGHANNASLLARLLGRSRGAARAHTECLLHLEVRRMKIGPIFKILRVLTLYLLVLIVDVRAVVIQHH